MIYSDTYFPDHVRIILLLFKVPGKTPNSTQLGYSNISKYSAKYWLNTVLIWARVILEHHLPNSGGHFLPRVVIPDELRVLVRALKYVHGGLGVVSHGVHEHAGKETDQRQTHLAEMREYLMMKRRTFNFFNSSIRVCTD